MSEATGMKPYVDFDLEDIDHDAEEPVCVRISFRSDKVSRGEIELSKLNPHISESDDTWKLDFDSLNIYPAITVEIDDSGCHILDGNHRVQMWREWGFAIVDAWIVDSSSAGQQQKDSRSEQ